VRSLQATEARYTFCGHMHEPKLFNLSGTGKAGDFVPTPGVAIPVPPHRQWLVIPGSAGQPRDGNPAACYAMLDEAAGALTFHRVPYDHETAGAKIRAADLPQRLASRLEDGH
jgi:diadenosine tetraphosphatase ApaH/serine/threonine PP2A family protein phosphatase